jgi:hypothetical protein
MGFTAIGGALRSPRDRRRPADDVVYPVSEFALRRKVGVEQETTSVDVAYAGHGRRSPARYKPEWLPEG